MSTETDQILKEQFKTLPKVIQDTILNSNWEEKIRRVVKVNNLHIDQGAAIENLVLITMLGIETPENFVENAKEFAKVSEDQAYSISAEVEREIFGDIRKKLIEITDVSGTVAEIDQATNELDKVAEAIEKEAGTFGTPKKSLKDKIPSNYFEEDVPVPPKEDPYKEPIIEVQAPEPVPEPIKLTHTPPKIVEPPKPLFEPMPKEIPVQNSQPVAKVDPYRESIE